MVLKRCVFENLNLSTFTKWDFKG